MKKNVYCVCAVLAMLAICDGDLVQADLVSFEDIATPRNFNVQNPTFVSGNYSFTQAGTGVSSFHAVARDDQSNIPNRGSNTYIGDGGAPASIVMVESNGASFDLISVFAAEGRNTNTGYFDFSSRSIDVLGTFAAGGTISANLNLDLFAQEDDSNDFELFTFVGFEQLSSVQFTGVGGPYNGHSFALDDINVVSTAVPELGSFALFATGLIGLGFNRRRRGQNRID